MLLLLFRGTGDDGGAGKGCGVGRRGKSGVAPSELFVHENFLKRAQSGSAVGFGDVEVQQAHLVRSLDGFLRVVRRFIPVFSVGTDFILSKLVSEFFQHGLHLVELEVHHVPAKRRSLKSD